MLEYQSRFHQNGLKTNRRRRCFGSGWIAIARIQIESLMMWCTSFGDIHVSLLVDVRSVVAHMPQMMLAGADTSRARWTKLEAQ